MLKNRKTSHAVSIQMSGVMQKRFFPLLLSVMLLLSGATDTVAEHAISFETTKTLLSRHPKNSLVYLESEAISPDTAHIAFVAKSDMGMFVVRDGKSGKIYDHVAKGYPIFSPRGNRLGYIADRAGKVFVVVDDQEYPGFDGASDLSFSPDGTRFSYIAQKGKKQVVVLDGKVKNSFDFVDRVIGVIFSPDSRHTAYSGLINNKETLFVDGKPQPFLFDTIEEFMFSPDSKQFAFTGNRDKKYYVIQNSNSFGPFEKAGGLVWSPDSKQLVLVAIKLGKWITVKNGAEIPSGRYYVKTVFNPVKKQYEYLVPEMTMPVFSPDSSRLAFTMAHGSRYRICVDGEMGPLFDSVSTPFFSPDSKHLAYIGVVSQKQTNNKVLILDGKQVGNRYKHIEPPLVFSPDSSKIAYRAKDKDNKWLVVVNGKEYPQQWDAVDLPVFSPDSRHIAYRAQKNGLYTIVKDGIFSRPFLEATTPVFSPNGDYLAYLGKTEEVKSHLFVNNIRVADFTIFLTESQKKYRPVIFDSPGHLHFISFQLIKNRFSVYKTDVYIKH